MKTRRHHNNKGLRQIKRGKTYKQVQQMAKRLGIPMEGSMSDRLAGTTWDNPVWHRGFRIYLSDYEGFCYCHDDYDGADDANDNRAGVCQTVEDCIEEINQFWPDLDKLG